MDHAYAITDYKSQGATTQRLIWYAPIDAGPLSSNSFYVAITRCKEEVGVYTNDAESLREKVKTEQQKESTLDYNPVVKKKEEVSVFQGFVFSKEKIFAKIGNYLDSINEIKEKLISSRSKGKIKTAGMEL